MARGRIVCLGIAVVVAVAFVLYAVLPLRGYVPYDDLLLNQLALRGTVETGLPLIRPPPGSPNSRSEDPGFVYTSYLLENYLRLPFYVAADLVPFDWWWVSSVAYLLLVLGAIIWLAVRGGASEWVGITAVFLVLAASSSLVSGSFWFARYYPLLILACGTLHGVGCFTVDRGLSVRGAAAIAALAALPMAFHLTGAPLFLYWAGMAALACVGGARLPEGRVRFAWAGGSLLALAWTGCLVWEYRDQLVFSPSFAVLQGFRSVNALSLRGNLVPTALLAAVAVWLYRDFPPLARRVLAQSLGAVAFSVGIYSCFGSQEVGARPAAYLLFVHVVWVWALAAAVTGIGSVLARRFPHPGPEAFAVAIAVTLALAFPIRAFRFDPMNQVSFVGFDRWPVGVAKREVEEVRARIAEVGPETIFLSELSTFFFVHFPKSRVFRIFDPGVQGTGFAGTEFRAHSLKHFALREFADGEIRDVYGSSYAGRNDLLCRALSPLSERTCMVVWFENAPHRFDRVAPSALKGVLPMAPFVCGEVAQRACAGG